MEIGDERRNRYRARIGYIIEKMDALPDNIDILDDLGVDGILYRTQTSIEAAMDIVAMLVKDIGIEVKDDYDNIDTIVEKKLIGKDLEEELKRLNGMRNAIVHRYGDVNTEFILKNLERIKEILYRFIKEIEGELVLRIFLKLRMIFFFLMIMKWFCLGLMPERKQIFGQI